MERHSTPERLVGLLLCASLLSACQAQSPNPRLSVVLVCDLSGSIEPEARVAIFQAIETVVGSLRRGDSLTIIPVTSDVEAQASGRILRFRVSAARELYDEDLRRLRATAQKSLAEMQAAAMNTPASRTDLLGAFRVAAEELAWHRANERGVTIVLSDFIQDDSQYNFNRDTRLSRPAAAKQLATQLAAQKSQQFKNTPIYVGYLRSTDLSRLNRNRRDAIREFWLAYLKELGATPQCITDGPGLLPRFLSDARTPSVSQ